MLTSARIREDLAPHEHVAWITSLRSPSIRDLYQRGKLQLSLFDETDLAEITNVEEFPNERLIACFNPLLADERARKREALLLSAEKKLARIEAATKRDKKPLRGAAKIGHRVGNTLATCKVEKHFTIDVTDNSITFARDADKIASESALDGIYVVRTSVPHDELDNEAVVRTYKSLSEVERAFRAMKTIDLHVRPIHHRREDRVRTHVFVCMLYYYLEWHMRQRLAPLLFDDDDPEGAQRRRSSIVAPAKRSAAADAKAQTKRTPDDHVVMSFPDLLASLSTVAKSWMRPADTSFAPFPIITTPLPHQQRALDLLGVKNAL